MVRKMTKKKLDQWFLTVVDMEKEEVIYADSGTDCQPTKTRNEIRNVVSYVYYKYFQKFVIIHLLIVVEICSLN